MLKKYVFLCFIGLLTLFSLPTLAQPKLSSLTAYIVTWSPTANQIAIADNEHNIKVLDAATERLVMTLAHDQYASNIRWSPDGTLIAANLYTAKNLNIWDTATGAPKFSAVEKTGSLGLEWTADGHTVITGTDGTDEKPELRLWDVATGQQIRHVQVGGAGIFRGPNNRLLALVPSYQVTIVDASTLKPIAQLGGEVHADYDKGYMATGVAWSPDEKWIAAGYLNGMVRLWSAQTFKPQGEFFANEQPYRNYGGLAPSTVISVTVNADQTLWSVSIDGTLRQWDITTGRRLADHSLGGKVLTAAWSAYGAQLAIGFAPTEQSTNLEDNPTTVLSHPGLRILTPASSINQIRAVAHACLADQQQQDLQINALTLADIPVLIQTIHALPAATQSSACVGDLAALAEALQATGN